MRGLSLVVESRGYSVVAVGGFLTVATSLVMEPGFQDPPASVFTAHGLCSCGSPLTCQNRNKTCISCIGRQLPTTGPPGEPSSVFFKLSFFLFFPFKIFVLIYWFQICLFFIEYS